MNKYRYRLMCKGLQRVVIIAGQQYVLPKGSEWRVPYYSEEKYVYAKDEEMARIEIRTKLKKKWTGFRLLREEQ